MKKLFSRTRIVRTEVVLFLVLWLGYGLAINSRNLEDFGLQHSGVEAIVERRQFGVENLSSWPVNGDVFGYNGHTYTNKQPGQAMVGAVAYSLVRLTGLSYAKNRLLAAALVTFFTSSLLTALAGIAVFRLAQGLDDGHSNSWAIATTLAFGFGTTAFAYSGISHHDAIATAFLFIAFYVIFTLSHDPSSNRMKITKALLAGLLMGLTLTTSMLHFLMAVVVGLYFLSGRQWKLLVPFLTGGVAGVAPMMFYNAVNFGSPFLLPAVANYKFTGYDPEAFFRFEWNNFVERVNVYSQFIVLYAPVLWFGLLGLYFLPPKYRREKYFVTAAVFVLFFYVVNMQTFGNCLYGPRYLLPIMPFATVGLIGLRRVQWNVWKYPMVIVLLLVGMFSAFVNLVGAVKGAMFCDASRYALPDYLAAINRGELSSFPLLRWLLPVTVGLFSLFIIRAISRRATTEVPTEYPLATEIKQTY